MIVLPPLKLPLKEVVLRHPFEDYVVWTDRQYRSKSSWFQIDELAPDVARKEMNVNQSHVAATQDRIWNGVDFHERIKAGSAPQHRENRISLGLR